MYIFSIFFKNGNHQTASSEEDVATDNGVDKHLTELYKDYGNCEPTKADSNNYEIDNDIMNHNTYTLKRLNQHFQNW